MDAAFWRQRWQDNKIGFHQTEPTPLLQTHWPAVDAAAGCQVFVPLAGKSLDMLWLAAQGHRVLGVELSQLAVEQFFAEHGLDPHVSASDDGIHYRAGAIELICGDAFLLHDTVLANCAAVFDRAALIALPPEMRRRYVDELYARLPADCRGLLITIEYPAHEKQGPPFALTEGEVRDRYGARWDIDLLERRDILATQQNFIDEGVTALETCAYRLQRRH